MLEVSALTKTFGSGSNKLQVLKGVDMNIKTGEMVALMGPSGSGKSTLLNIIGGLLAGDGGSITLGNKTYGQKSPSNVVDVRRESVGWIFQDFHLLDNLTAVDNVANLRAQSGGKLSTLGFVSDYLDVKSVGLASANSRIMDADLAEESINLTKYNIQYQAAAAALVQSNLSMEVVLELLRFPSTR